MIIALFYSKFYFIFFFVAGEMEVQKYFDQKEELYINLIAFIENREFDDKDFEILIENIDSLDIKNSKEEMEHFFRLIISISNNHYRFIGFQDKIERILQYFDNIQIFFTNSELYNIFESNKRILAYFLKKQIIIVNEFIYDIIKNKQEMNGVKFLNFFLPEIKNFEKDEKEIEKIEKEIQSYSCYDEKRSQGENDSYIASLIRQDSIEEFVSYTIQTNYSLSSIIKPSVFETNSFLNDNEPTLIEYAAFFGSIQIFNYLKISGIELIPSLWLYSIHSNDAEMIHLLEENQVKPPNNSYETCLFEAIKCHHNVIAQYIENNLISNPQNQLNFDEKITDCSFCYYNYFYFPKKYTESYLLFYYCQYNYYNIVDIFFHYKSFEIQRMLTITNYKYNNISIIMFSMQFIDSYVFK